MLKTEESRRHKSYDAVIVGAGPNGLAAAITLAREGLSVVVLEAEAAVGGGMRSAALTLPGYIHDVCSSIYPMAVASPFFKDLPLHNYGLQWVHPPLPLAHPLDSMNAVVLERSLAATAAALQADSAAYMQLLDPFVANADPLISDLIGPLRLPKHPILAFRFARKARLSARHLADSSFSGEDSKALWAGLAAHSVLPLSKPLSAAVALVMAMAGHAYGWPLVRGGSQNLTHALTAYLQGLGSHIHVEARVRTIHDIPPAAVILFDLSPRQILGIEGLPLSSLLRQRLQRYRYGPGVFKVDWALSEPIPWLAKECGRAGTVHVGGSMAEITRAEAETAQGRISEHPFVFVTQPSLFDPSRAPPGKHSAWGYCHVPHASKVNRVEAIEGQIERFAPGFKDCILARHSMGPTDFEAYNANYIGGDIVGGVADLRQLFTGPGLRLNPYHLSGRSFICSASTPPGAGVHGLCGYFAAKSAMTLFSH